MTTSTASSAAPTESSAACSTLFSSSGSPRVAGVDGCRAGWVVVLRDRQTGAARARVVRDFAAVLGLPEAPAAIAIVVPIGLPDFALPGGRACDRGARALLPSRASSVFSAPSRAALGCFRTGGGYPEVCLGTAGLPHSQ
jgi:predicted RNase H-like nuclease